MTPCFVRFCRGSPSDFFARRYAFFIVLIRRTFGRRTILGGKKSVGLVRGVRGLAGAAVVKVGNWEQSKQGEHSTE